MILSHMAPSYVNLGPSRTIWTHFTSNSVIVVKNMSGPRLGPAWSQTKSWTWHLVLDLVLDQVQDQVPDLDQVQVLDQVLDQVPELIFSTDF